MLSMPESTGAAAEEAERNKCKNACQIAFDDDGGATVYKSLYLDTLGEAARRSPSPVDRHHKSHCSEHARSCREGYVHGSLSTTKIRDSSPAVHSLTKHKQALHEAALDTAAAGDLQEAPATEAMAMTAAVFRPNVLGQFDDPGMKPKVLILTSTNRPDLTHSTADIEGAQPCPKDICHHPRNTNPLSPQYHLASGRGVRVPCGPETADRLLRDTLDVKDILGAVPRPQAPAARVAAARAAAAGAGDTRGGNGVGSSRSPHSSWRPDLLDVADIPGATTAWRPTHRRHMGVCSRDTCLNVSDITSYMARFKPGPRNSAEYKGHPQGPRAPSPIRPRSNPNIMDNSLRKFDIEGTSVRLAPRAKHTTCLDVDDIQGAHPRSKEDRAQLFADRKTQSAAASAQQELAKAVLSGLQLSQQELLVLWSECSRLDRDKSGFLTAHELAAAMQHAQLQLSPNDAQQLVAALRDNAGLLNYKKLTRQLKGHLSRPASAGSTMSAAQLKEAAEAATAQQLTQVQQQGQPRRQQQRPQSAQTRSRLHRDGTLTAEFAAAAPCAASSSSSIGIKAGCRPSTAPARPCAVAASSPCCCCSTGSNNNSSRHQECSACARRWSRSNRVGVSSISHWFAGSSRDAVAAEDAAAWRPGPAADALCKGWALNSQVPWMGSSREGQAASSPEPELQPSAAAADAECGAVWDEATCGGSTDVVPAWLLGADAVQGTCRVLQPFGPWPTTAADKIAGAGQDTAQHVLEQLQPAALQNVFRGGSSRPAIAPSANHMPKRPASAGSCYLRQSAMLAGQLETRTTSSSNLQRPASALAEAVSCRRPNLQHGLMIKGSSSSSLSLAERRRLCEVEQQDLHAVRQLL